MSSPHGGRWASASALEADRRALPIGHARLQALALLMRWRQAAVRSIWAVHGGRPQRQCGC